VPQYRFTEYFEKEVLRKRPYLKKEWCIRVLQEPLKNESQEGNRYRFWGKIEEFEGRIFESYYVGGQAYNSQRFSGQRFQTMKLNYYADTDSLYIDLSERPSVESREITEGIVLDYDAEGNLVGIDIDNASRKVDLKKLTLNKLPAIIQTNPG
jgi:uncharacterized protein YuzE